MRPDVALLSTASVHKCLMQACDSWHSSYACFISLRQCQDCVALPSLSGAQVCLHKCAVTYPLPYQICGHVNIATRVQCCRSVHSLHAYTNVKASPGATHGIQSWTVVAACARSQCYGLRRASVPHVNGVGGSSGLLAGVDRIDKQPTHPAGPKSIGRRA